MARSKVTILRNKKGRIIGRSRSAVVNLDKPTKTAVAKIAKSVINKAQETKYVAQQFQSEPLDIYGSTTPTSGVVQVYDVMPELVEGTSEFQRIGVKVQPSSHVVDLDLRFNTRQVLQGISIDRYAWDINVHIWWGYVKKYKYAPDLMTNALDVAQNLLEDGQGTTFAWTGGPYQSYLSLNKEANTLKHKVVRMYRPLGAQNTADGIQQTYFPQVIHKTMRLAFKPPKVLLYNENNNVPENYAPVVIIGYCHNDGTQASNTTVAGSGYSVQNTPALQANMNQHMWFRDA